MYICWNFQTKCLNDLRALCYNNKYWIWSVKYQYNLVIRIGTVSLRVLTFTAATIRIRYQIEFLLIFSLLQDVSRIFLNVKVSKAISVKTFKWNERDPRARASDAPWAFVTNRQHFIKGSVYLQKSPSAGIAGWRDHGTTDNCRNICRFVSSFARNFEGS